MYKEWLQCKLTIREAENKNMVHHRRLGLRRVPFGFQNSEWKQLIAQMTEGDELWKFCSPEETWRNLCGREGIALVRDDQIINFIVTKLN